MESALLQTNYWTLGVHTLANRGYNSAGVITITITNMYGVVDDTVLHLLQMRTDYQVRCGSSGPIERDMPRGRGTRLIGYTWLGGMSAGSERPPLLEKVGAKSSSRIRTGRTVATAAVR
jgi:hypothetical protein